MLRARSIFPPCSRNLRAAASTNSTSKRAFALNGSLVREGCVDEFLIYLNPSFLGDEAQGMVELPAFEGLEKRPKLKVQSLVRIGDDIRILARL